MPVAGLRDIDQVFTIGGCRTSGVTFLTRNNRCAVGQKRRVGNTRRSGPAAAPAPGTKR